MPLRVRLIVAFLLLSVVPLSAVTLYSYTWYVKAFQQTVETEAKQTAAEMSRRMERITASVSRRIDRLFEPADPTEPPPRSGGRRIPPNVRDRAAPLLGEMAALLESLEFHPEGTHGPGAPATSAAQPRARAPLPRPPRPDRAPPPIVIDLHSLIEEVKKSAADGAPSADLIRRGVDVGVSAAEIGARAAAAALAREATRSAATPDPEIKQEGRTLEIPVRRDGRLIGKANAVLNLQETMGTVLALSRREQGEIAFAIDTRGRIYTPDDRDKATLAGLGVAAPASGEGVRRSGEWVIVTRRDPAGFTFGIARPVGHSLREIRRASIQNLSLGLLLIGLAIVGIVPISTRMTRNLTTLTGGVRKLAGGDFQARVPVRSSDEFGMLASAFNQMAQDLERQQYLAVEQERLRRELELSRLIQTEMLPHAPLHYGAAEVQGVSIPAREVGGDFFNYFVLPDGTLALLVGDVSGKGVSAALLMANAQATLRARIPGEADLAKLADALDREFEASTPRGVFLTLFMGVLDPVRGVMRYVNAGHHPQFLVRAGGGLERLSSSGLPIGLFSGHGFTEQSVAVGPGDLLFFYTDGLVETENERADQFGAAQLEAILAAEHEHAVETVLVRVEDAVRTFRGAAEPLDDATMMALRVGVALM